ncbi:hypothetical protein Lser_V15G33268 [Lactuca serriola]
MMHLMQQFECLKIQLKAIKLATKNFANENCIGRGGFGKVYKGELVHYKGKEIVAIKRLDPVFGQGNPEFWREIIMLSLYKHDNIVSLLGFCDESDEKILVYEYASRRSLDSYLNKDDLIWIQRLNICIGAARGLAYLHNPFGTQQRVLHRDIKSSNILLDENWNAKISDLGLSKFGPANQDYTFLVTNGVGTIGYCDPLYMETGLLTKESDVYSFGVVLFEVLCGRLCISNKNGIHRPSLTGLVRQYYSQNKIKEIIFDKIKDEINPKSLEAFTTIAYRCLSRDLEERPLMTDIVSILESAREYQLELNSFDLKNNPIQSSSYEQGETTQEKSSDMLVLMLCSIGVWEGFYPLRNKWIRLPTIPCEESFNYSEQESVAVGSELLVFGREVLGFVIWKYSFIRRHWLKCDGMNHPRRLFGSGTLGSIAIVAGGCDKNGNILKSAELYDSSTGRWEILPDMHSPRRLCSSFFMDKKFYVIGGMTSSTDSLTCGEEFDLNTKHWRKIDGMYPIIVNKVTQAPPLVAVVSNELYALDYLSSMVKKYDKYKNSWDVLGRLPVKASSMEGWGLVFKACGDGLLVVYGQRTLGNESLVLNSCSPKSRVEDGILDWNVLGVKEQKSPFIYDCVVMDC